jgi:sulfofructose kinase
VITIDTIALVDKYPGEDERVLADEISRAGGGPAAVAAVALSRLGVKSAIVGTIGDDADGKEVLRIFQYLHKSNKHKMIPIPVCKIPINLYSCLD